MIKKLYSNTFAMSKFFTFSILLLFCTNNFAQQISQTIRGKIYDRETHEPIPGCAVVLLSDSSAPAGTVTDTDGNYRIGNVPVGRRTIVVQMMGYHEQRLQNIIVTAGKEVILNIELEGKVAELDEVVISGNKKGESSNEMALVSSRVFAVEETDRYAGSRSDPSRMASNFAGVQGSNDSRNDIVIRGNSPMGLLWRVEGVDIPNPNHFAIAGTAGGAVNILNNKMFSNSDFFTGAFPAEYGNANAGVFDIRFRNGNNEKRETTFQLGFLGTELSTEGPLSKTKGSTYLITYRYSTLKLFESFNIKLGTSAVPSYQDLAFKLNFPTKKNGNWSVFGIGGTSRIDILLSQNPVDEEEVYGMNDRDQTFSTSMGVLGTSYAKTINSKTYFKATLAGYLSNAWAHHNLFYRDSVTLAVDTMFPKLRYSFKTTKITANVNWNTKINNRHSYKTGIIAEELFINFVDSNYIQSLNVWDNRVDYTDATFLLRPYFQWKYKKSDNLTYTAGIHGLYFGLNNRYSIEPRLGMRWNIKPRHALSAGYGMHSQLLPLYIYYHHEKDATGTYRLHNKNLDLSRSMHAVLSYDYAIKPTMRLKAETYYQHLYNIPVDTFSSSFSLLNQGSQFIRFFPNALENKGTGYNYGFELTLEKFFSKSYFFMITGSVYDSKFKGSDGVLRNTDFNGTFAANMLGTKEWKLNPTATKVIVTGIKTTWAGGKRYSPADIAASNFAGELVDQDSLRNTLRFRNYFRLDLKLGLKINTKKITHEIAFDLVNVLNTKNTLGLTYAPNPKNPSANPIREEYQLGFLPLFYYKVDF